MRTSVGLEIECNYLSGFLVDRLSKDWDIVGEHCGHEFRSKPCHTPSDVRNLIRKVRLTSKQVNGVGFENAGNHIHLNFAGSPSDVKRKFAKKDKENGGYKNPTGVKHRRVYWTNGEKYWITLDSYLRSRFGPLQYISTDAEDPEMLLDIKRFMVLGSRFADLLLCMQHPSRRFNKYCHTISDWSEERMLRALSIREIVISNYFQINHRRIMFNAKSFSKFGTVEARMMAATFDWKEVWAFMLLLMRMGELAKLRCALPMSSGDIRTDFRLLMDACGIRGKSRRLLESKLIISLSTKQFLCRCSNLGCERVHRQENFIDLGLSRPLCMGCNETMFFCAKCGRRCTLSLSRGELIDNKPGYDRYICNDCLSYISKEGLISIENQENVIFSAGIKIGSGFDENGFNALRRMREIFK